MSDSWYETINDKLGSFAGDIYKQMDFVQYIQVTIIIIFDFFNFASCSAVNKAKGNEQS